GETRKGTKRSRGRVNRELNTLSRIFSLALEDDLVHKNPVRKKRFKIDDERKRILSVSEERRLMKALERNDRVRMIVIIALYTGMRRGEIFNLKWCNIDFDRELIHVRNTKTAKDRSIPIITTVGDVLSSLKPKACGNEFVFARTRRLARKDSRYENPLS